jgi:hypothetical protein
MDIQNLKVKECVFDRLYDEIVEMVKHDMEKPGLKGAVARLGDRYLNKIEKIKNNSEIDEESMYEIVDNLIEEFYFEKVPLIIEAFGLDSKNYLSILEKEIQDHIKDCEAEIEENKDDESEEEVLYEDDDLKVVVRDGVKSVVYKTNSFDIPEDHPLYRIIETFFKVV